MGSGKSKKKKSGGFFHDKPSQTITIPKYTPQQEGLQNSALEHSLKGLSSLPLPGQQLTSSFDFAPIAQSATANFNQNTIPSLAERFTSLGQSSNSISSPSFVNQLGQAGAGLEGELARLGAEYGLQKQGLEQNERGQQASNLFNILNTGLGERFDTLYQPKEKAGWKKLLGGIGNAALSVGSAYLGAPGGLGSLSSSSAPQGVQNVGSQNNMNQGSGYVGWGNNSAGFNNQNQQLGSRSAGSSALLNQNQQFANPQAQPGYRDIINLLARR